MAHKSNGLIKRSGDCQLRFCTLSAIVTGMGLLALACTGATPPARLANTRWRTTKIESAFKLKDFGNVPKFNAVDDGQMQPLVEAHGALQQGILARNTQLTVQGTEEIFCELKQGTEVSVVGTKGEHILVALDAPCLTRQGKKIYEGYVSADALQPAQADEKSAASVLVPGSFQVPAASQTGSSENINAGSNTNVQGSFSGKNGGNTSGNLPDTGSQATLGGENIPGGNPPPSGQSVPSSSPSKAESGQTPATEELPQSVTGCSQASQTVMRGVKIENVAKGMFESQYQKSAAFDTQGCTSIFEDTIQTYKKHPAYLRPQLIAKHRALCGIPGDVFRRGGVTDDGVPLGLLIKGSASSWKITVTMQANETFGVKGSQGDMEPITETINGAEFYHKETDSTLIPMPQILKNPKVYGGGGMPGTFEIIGLDRNNTQVGNTCYHKFQVVSPIVFDLSGKGDLEIVPPSESGVHFDLDADGSAEQTAWIAGEAGFLALDENNNGRIDNGNELFGNARKLANGTKASNGYEALADFDANKDGFIDEKDSVYPRLIVWKDANGDGQSSKDELHALASLGIKRIAVVPQKSQFDEVSKRRQNGLGSRIPLEARYFGPSFCPKEGCLSYDVFFATVKP